MDLRQVLVHLGFDPREGVDDLVELGRLEAAFGRGGEGREVGGDALEGGEDADELGRGALCDHPFVKRRRGGGKEVRTLP